MTGSQVRRLGVLRDYVSENFPDLLETVFERGKVVEIKAETVGIGDNTTKHFGALLQVLCYSGAVVVAFCPEQVRQIRYEQ